MSVQSMWAASGLFPKMPMATNVYVFDCQKDNGDARVTDWALQGMINQQSAEVYIINLPWAWGPLKDYGRPYEVVPLLDGDNGGLRALFKKYNERIQKMFVYDPEKDWTCYLALMAAAQQHGIAVAEPIKDQLTSEFGWKGGLEDFRNKWENRFEAYDWALANLMPGCSRQVVFTMTDDVPLIDYAVSSKGFIFWLDFNTEQAEIEKIFQTRGYGLGTSLMGYGNTGDSANTLANPHGIGYVVSCLFANGSYWSSFPNTAHTQAPGHAIPVQPGKIYAHIKWSDGDNLEMDQNPLYKFWHDPARGTIPVATELATSLQELDSPLLDWYYSQMTTNDELVSGAPGVQFIDIENFNDRLFPAWCKMTHAWCTDAGFHACRIWSAPIPSVKYTTYMTTCGFDGIFGEGWRIKAGFPPEVDSWGADNEEDLYYQIVKIKPDPQKPVFCGFTCVLQGFYQGDHGYSAVKRVIDRVEAAYPGRYIFLLPKDEFATIRAYYNATVKQVKGLPGTHEGLTPMEGISDGKFTTVERDGINCWLISKRSSPNYFYLKVADSFRPEPGKTLEIDLSYFDVGSGDIVLEYDSTDIRFPGGGAYKRYPFTLHRMNSGQWQLARFYVNDAGFGGTENNADLRFYTEGDDLMIRAVQILRK